MPSSLLSSSGWASGRWSFLADDQAFSSHKKNLAALSADLPRPPPAKGCKSFWMGLTTPPLAWIC